MSTAPLQFQYKRKRYNKMQPALSEDTMIRLFNSVAQNDQPGTTLFQPIEPESTGSLSSDNTKSADTMLGSSCRICRWNRSDMQLAQCPCGCKGSVGFVHLVCLKKWILQRRDNRCEICHQIFDIPEEKTDYRRMFSTFFSGRCIGEILKNIACSISLLPLANVILQQVLICMERINQSQNPQLTVKEVALASFALLTSSAMFFHFFEYITIRFMVVRNIFRQWWMFGGAEEYESLELPTYSFDVL